MPALQFDLPAADVLAAMQARIGVIDLATPPASRLLTMPLYEVPPDTHPNATFATTDDPIYQKWLRWIEGGAQP